jgi:hypothetical protein
MDETRQEQREPVFPEAPTPAGQAGGGDLDAVISGIVRTGPWARFIAVLGFITAGLLCLAGLIIMLAGGAAGQLGLGVGVAVGLFYLAIAAVYLIPVVPLNRFANEASRLREEPSAAIAARAIEQSRAFWTRFGVLTIIGLALVPVAIIVSIFAALATR